MATTALSIIGVPGKPHSFSPKAAAAAGPHTGGPFTKLSVIATPGKIHSFSAKTADGAGPHTGLFTELSVMALPGMRHSFSAKTAAEEDYYGKIIEKGFIDDILMWVSIITPVIDKASKN